MKLKQLLALALLVCSTGAWAQTDVTSTYITNAGFDESGDFQTVNVATGNSNQRKAVTGWTNTGGDTYTTGAAIGFGTSGQINGANLPSQNSDGTATGGALCLNAAWKSQVWYSQEVTLPAGNYTIKFMVNNVGKNAQWNNDPPLFTFTTSLNTFAGNVNSYPLNTWTEQKIEFSLATETTGTIKIGYKANDTGSGNTPKFVVDYVKAFYNSNYTATLQSAIDRATRLYNRTSDSDLNSAIAVAQSVLDEAGIDVDYQATIDGAVTTLRNAIATAQGKLVLEGEEDITYLLENADFESSPALTGGVCTYAYDCAGNGVFYSQMQQVEGWEVVGNDNGKAAGVFAFGSNAWIANKSYTAESVTSSIGENNALALVGAWSGTVQYKQTVTLPAGIYVLTVPVFNSNGGTAINKNLIGFITNSGTEYLATTTSYPVGSTKTETINFTLEAETEGYISLGYTAAGTGSGNMPKMFIDGITIKYFTADKSALYDKLAEAQTYQTVLNNSNLADAIIAAQAVYDNGQALQSAVDAQVTALNTAISNALANIANGTNVTALFVKNNSFEEGGDKWTFNTASDTGVKENSNGTYTTTGVDGAKLFNTWGGSDAKYVKQTLSELPDGYYVISALVASDEGNIVTLYAGSGTNDVPTSYNGKGLFLEGKAGAVQPTDGSLEIGATSTNWYKVDNFQLFYYDNESDALAAIAASDLAVAVANYDAVLASAQSTSNDAITGKELADLEAAIDADNTLDKNSLEAVNEAYNNLKAAINTFNSAAGAYERAAYAISKASDTTVDATDLSTLKAASSTVAADLTDPTNDLLAAVINSYAPGEFGFEKGQYSPYNNVDGLALLAVADEVASKTTDEITETITALQADNLWTINEKNANLIYNGHFAEANGNNPKGWTRSNDAWGQQITGLEASTGAETSTAWYYNTNGAWEYGKDGVYTLPLAANQTYELSFKYRKHDNDWQNWMKASVVNGENEGLEVAQFSPADNGTNFVEAKAYFTTGAAGNYILSIEQNGNAHLTDVSLVKVASATLVLSEDEDYAPIDRTYYETVSLTRTVKEGYNTVVLPFDLTAEQVAAVFGEGAKVYSFTETSESADNVAVQFDETATISANVPVLVNATAESTVKNINNVVFKSGEAKVEGANVDFVGVYSSAKVEAGDYFIANSKLYKCTKDDFITIKPFRAYIDIDAPEETNVKFFFGGVEYTDIATALNAIEAAGARSTVFNLAGQRVGKAQKGVYVVGGKKVIIK